MKGIARDVPMSAIYRGIAPFFAADMVRILLVLSFPQIALVLVR